VIGRRKGDLHGLPSEAFGTTAGDLIAPCRRHYPRHADPPDPDSLPAFAIALSGGGFRATLAAVGVLRFLADSDLLSRVRWVSSVSGGSIANGVFAAVYPELAERDFDPGAFVEFVEGPIVHHVSSGSLSLKLFGNAWRTIGPDTRTTVLARALDDWFFRRRKLADLSSDCRFIFNAANLTTGVRFGFERDVVGDYVIGNVSTEERSFRLAEAVAASAAVPGFFPAFIPKGDFPCLNGRKPRIVDGGVYENTGLEPIEDLRPERACIVGLNAGGVFRTNSIGRVPVVRDLMRSEGLLYRQSTALRTRHIVEGFQAWERARNAGQPAPEGSRQGVLFGLATSIAVVSPDWVAEEHADLRLSLARLKTSFAKFPLEQCRQLVYRGWWLTGASLATYHRQLLPAKLPDWRQLV
jgi:NTE family protein